MSGENNNDSGWGPLSVAWLVGMILFYGWVAFGEEPSSSTPSNNTPAISIQGGLDCADISGSVIVGASDPHDLDRDGDGIGCE